MQYQGGCHCGAVRFEFDADLSATVHRCNCSLCTRVGFLHLIIPRSAFNLLCGEDTLCLYQFNTRVAKHYFCRVCGVKSFYVPRSNPDGVSINYTCIDDANLATANIEDFDGQNWEQHAAELAHLSD